MSEQSNIYKKAKIATLKEIRALKIGDIIECYYTDSEQPVHELVLSTTWNNREGDAQDIRTLPLKGLGIRSHQNIAASWLNTDKFRRVAHGADIAERIQTIAAQSSGVADLTDMIAGPYAK